MLKKKATDLVERIQGAEQDVENILETYMTSEDAISAILANGMLYAPKNNPTAAMLKAAFDIAISALEKQIPKKPERGVCPNCNSRHIYAATLTTAECFKHCGDCGQALDWSDNEPTKPKGRRMFSDEQIDRILWEIQRIPWEIKQVNKKQREKELKSTKEGD